MNRAGIYLVIAFLAVVFLYVYRRREAMNDRLLFLLAAVTSYACFLLLPAMHERYDYLPIVLIAVYYAYYRREKIYIAAAVVLVTSVMYCAYLFDGYFAGIRMPEEIYALICFVMLYLMIKEFTGELNGIRDGKETTDVHQDQ
jgi:uncharacterized membrane protein YfcA